MGIYSLYRWERLVEKTMKICIIILKSKLSRFTVPHKKTPPTMEKEKSNLSSKYMSEAHKKMDITMERGIDQRQILTYNLVSASSLFDGDIPAHTNKPLPLVEIEPRLDLTQWHQESTVATHVVDFMSNMRKMPLAQFPNMGVTTDSIIASASSLCHKC